MNSVFEIYLEALSLKQGEEIRVYCNSRAEQTHLMPEFREAKKWVEGSERFWNKNEAIIFKKEKLKDGRYSIILYKMKGPEVFIKKPDSPEEKVFFEEIELMKLLARNN